MALLPPKKSQKTYKPKPYEQMFYHGQRVQIDVKHVPAQCRVGEAKYMKLYQFTAIDEFGRLRYLEGFDECSTYSAAIFLQNAVRLFKQHGFEGVLDYPRRRLKNARYFTAVNKNPEEFWLKVCDYIEAHYDFLNTGQVFLSGDGSPWIRAGLQHIPGSEFILDRYHLAEYITQSTAHAPELRGQIYDGIRELDKQAVLGRLWEAPGRANEPSRQERIREVIKYIERNWEGIEAQVKYPHVTCSAEGHVSHILAARLSSRPMAWSVTGAERMSAIRSTRANGESIREHYLARQKPAPVISELKQVVHEEMKRIRQKRLRGKEYRNNVPLFRGGSSHTRFALKELNKRSVV